MPNIIIKSTQRREAERGVLRSFHGDSSNALHRECAECINAKTSEAMEQLRRTEEKHG